MSVPLGGMSAKGDPAKKPGKAIKAKNLFVRPFRLEKRPGWLRDGTLGTNAPHHFFHRTSAANVVTLCYGHSGSSAGAQRSGAPAWTDLTGTTMSGGLFDYTQFRDTVYCVANTSKTTAKHAAFSWDGSTEDTTPFFAPLSGDTICSFLNRLFIGAPVENRLGLLGSGVVKSHNDNTFWTVSGSWAQPTAASGVNTATIVNGSTDTITTASTFNFNNSYNNWHWASVRFRATHATQTIPFRLQIQDGSGTTIASEEFTLLNATQSPGNQTFVMVFSSQGNTTGKVAIKMGHADKAAPAISFVISDGGTDTISGTTAATHVAPGSLVGAWQGDSSLNFTGKIAEYRIVWSETDEPKEFRATNFQDLNEVPGCISVLRATEDRLFAFKENAIWIFRGTTNPDLPIQRERVLRGAGCVGPQSIRFFENNFYFIGKDEVYRMGQDGGVEPLAGPDMRETLFPATTSYQCLEIDRGRRQVWVHTITGKVHVYDIESGEWSYATFTDAADAELEIRDLWYGKPSGESAEEMYAIMDASADIVKLRAAQTQDNITGTARDVVAEYTFAPLQVTPPRQVLLLEDLAFYHDITATQTSTTCTWEVSLNNGATFGKTNQVTIAPLSSAAGAVDAINVPLWQSGPRLVVNLKHSGLAGPTYFNLSGAEATVQILGGEIEDSLPTQGSSSL